MTKFLEKSFSVAMPVGEEYRDNWDRIFGTRETIDSDKGKNEPCRKNHVTMSLARECGCVK